MAFIYLKLCVYFEKFVESLKKKSVYKKSKRNLAKLFDNKEKHF